MKIFHPDQFQGSNQTKNYFEGWYYKFVNADETKAFAVIPGIAMDDGTTKQSFIQVLDGKKCKASYYKFPLESFTSHSKKFDISIDNNNFSSYQIDLDLDQIKGILRFDGNIQWPVRWYSPGIMGPFAFVPFMECYHGIVSMDHRVFGELTIEGEKINFDNGRGYIEKDWGKSFPSAYIWMQSNHFASTGISIKASVAKIPWLGSSFVGFIVGLWIKDKLFQFTTYNGSKLNYLEIDNKSVQLTIENGNHKIEVNIQRNLATKLASPIQGLMDGRIEESMTSIIDVTLIDKKLNQKIFVDRGRNAGLEVAGAIEEIIRVRK